MEWAGYFGFVAWVTPKTLTCTVLDADEEWVKIRYQNKKQEEVVKIIRIENVLEVDL